MLDVSTYKMLFVAFFACGVFLCTLAKPTCDDHEILNVCSKNAETLWFHRMTWPENSAELSSFCLEVLQELECEIEFASRCPESMTADYLPGMLQIQSLYGNICDSSKPNQNEFFKNIPCINNHWQRISEECKENGTLIDSSCDSSVTHFAKCSFDAILNSCGVEVLKLFYRLLTPMLYIFERMCVPFENLEKHI
ncbi:uncharacterized protein LOC129217243 [Uloborus diversus]|uniref:uncharacterized protein LOC129217243 n=1 Tax=Uloborus diversus TaxID=327109 RepID=UPI002409B062|nr:uncharacterized protein LOC129217243 [Uloborus diversus]